MVSHAIEFLIALVAIGVVMWLDHKGHPASGVAAGAATHLVLRAAMLRLVIREGEDVAFDLTNLSLSSLESKGVAFLQNALRTFTLKNATPVGQAAGDAFIQNGLALGLDLLKNVVINDLVSKIQAKNPSVATVLTDAIKAL